MSADSTVAAFVQLFLFLPSGREGCCRYNHGDGAVDKGATSGSRKHEGGHEETRGRQHKKKKREAQVDCRQNPISIILVLILTLPPNLVFHPSCCCSSSIGICNKSRAEGRPQVKIGRRQHKAYDGSQPKRG